MLCEICDTPKILCIISEPPDFSHKITAPQRINQTPQSEFLSRPLWWKSEIYHELVVTRSNICLVEISVILLCFVKKRSTALVKIMYSCCQVVSEGKLTSN